jgi:hypothetical protein
MAATASTVGESAVKVGISGELVMMELAGGTLKVAEGDRYIGGHGKIRAQRPWAARVTPQTARCRVLPACKPENQVAKSVRGCGRRLHMASRQYSTV